MKQKPASGWFNSCCVGRIKSIERGEKHPNSQLSCSAELCRLLLFV
ncbi:hypothetical protein GXM_02998 [Nostoc sphaeroides CCNUC1]|uniref:Uncharacterized protein n=1 Tax=Nostoc sphaeroides CCNUC1 TaxID=2653204 RepID=A0A5P8VYX5_9NOSO|nr:hypothetical protein GXM_02998 [Nostoc sphaeroides CCNUC1]